MEQHRRNNVIDTDTNKQLLNWEMDKKIHNILSLLLPNNIWDNGSDLV